MKVRGIGSSSARPDHPRKTWNCRHLQDRLQTMKVIDDEANYIIEGYLVIDHVVLVWFLYSILQTLAEVLALANSPWGFVIMKRIEITKVLGPRCIHKTKTKLSDI